MCLVHGHMRHPAFTLIETLIYSALVALMLTFALGTMYTLIDHAGRTAQQRALADNYTFLESKLQWLLIGADSIITPLPSDTSATLSLNKLNNPQNPFVIDLQNNAIRLSRAGAPPVSLTNSRVVVSNLSFTHTVSGTISSIRINALLSNTVASLPFQTTISLR